MVELRRCCTLRQRLAVKIIYIFFFFSVGTTGPLAVNQPKMQSLDVKSQNINCWPPSHRDPIQSCNCMSFSAIDNCPGFHSGHLWRTTHLTAIRKFTMSQYHSPTKNRLLNQGLIKWSAVCQWTSKSVDHVWNPWTLMMARHLVNTLCLARELLYVDFCVSSFSCSHHTWSKPQMEDNTTSKAWRQT